MRVIVALGPVLAVAALGMAGCASQVESDMIACPEPRPQVCTLEYAPTCGVDAEGVRTEFSSPCNACANEGTVGYEPGPCPE